MKKIFVLLASFGITLLTHAGQDITSLQMPNGEMVHLGDTRSKLIYSLKQAPYEERYQLMSGIFKRKKVSLLKFNLDKHNYAVSLVSTKIVRIVKD